jgi:hypothetical protein
VAGTCSAPRPWRRCWSACRWRPRTSWPNVTARPPSTPKLSPAPPHAGHASAASAPRCWKPASPASRRPTARSMPSPARAIARARAEAAASTQRARAAKRCRRWPVCPMRSRTCSTSKARSRWRAPRSTATTHPPARRLAGAALQAAGAVLVGSLNMDEYAYGFTTENTHYGPCRNPHDLTRIAGGSSGGSGAAVAAGQVPLTLGSDTNGSIRVPSSLCGVWGLKPTFGRLSRRGSYPFVHSVDHLGPFADAWNGWRWPTTCCRARPAGPGLPCDARRAHGGRWRRASAGLRMGVLGGYFHDNATRHPRAKWPWHWPPRAGRASRGGMARPGAGPRGGLHRQRQRRRRLHLETCARAWTTSSRCRWTASSRARCSRPPGTCARSAFAASTATRSTRCSSTGTC